MTKSWGRVFLTLALLGAAINIGVATASRAAGGDGKFHVVGRNIIGPDGNVIRIRGVNKSGLEYTRWGYDFDVGTNAVDTFVSYLRRKLESGGAPRLIHTVRGVGFLLRRPT